MEKRIKQCMFCNETENLTYFTITHSDWYGTQGMYCDACEFQHFGHATNKNLAIITAIFEKISNRDLRGIKLGEHLSLA